MNQEIIKVLDKIEKSGFEAFIVGGYVRDSLLAHNSTDIDICTNALPKDLVKIFHSKNAHLSIYGSLKIITDKYNFDITTYRKEIKYVNHKLMEMEYINNLLEDLKRRDFTINTIVMNSKGNMIDTLGGINDIQNHLIKCVGEADVRFKEDPLRMLRAVRFATILDFKLDSKIVKSIKKNHKLIRDLSYDRKKMELDKVLTNKNAIKGLDLIKKLGLNNDLEIKYGKVKYVEDLCGMYAQISFSKNYQLAKQERKAINSIQKILKYGKIDNTVLFENGLYIASVAGSILNIDKGKITEMDSKLPIKSYKDMAIGSDDICRLLNLEPSKIIKIIQDDLKNNILKDKLSNDSDSLVKYIINNKRRWFNNGKSYWFIK